MRFGTKVCAYPVDDDRAKPVRRKPFVLLTFIHHRGQLRWCARNFVAILLAAAGTYHTGHFSQETAANVLEIVWTRHLRDLRRIVMRQAAHCVDDAGTRFAGFSRWLVPPHFAFDRSG